MKWPRHVPSWLSVAAGGYAVVGVFGFTFWIVNSRWPNLHLRTMLIIAVMAAAPLALGLVWQRLAAMKLFGVEISLSRVTVSIDEKILAAFSQKQYFSGEEHLIEPIQRAIVKPEIQLIEVNLHTEPYWWSTRLFLLAALADVYSTVEQFVFVEGGAENIYVGMISPRSLRRALGRQFPEMETTFREIHEGIKTGPSPSVQVGLIVHQWAASQFRRNGSSPIEEELKILVTRELLSNWLKAGGGELETDYLNWDGGPDSALLNYMLICRSSPYVALVRERRLEKVVNRIDLAGRVAENALRRQLS